VAIFLLGIFLFLSIPASAQGPLELVQALHQGPDIAQLANTKMIHGKVLSVINTTGTIC
jgi:hypothetical protein